MIGLEDILRDCFGCKKPFRKKPICVDTEPDGNMRYDRLTKQGWVAYDKLITFIYALAEIEAISDANEVIEVFDDIVNENGAYIV